MDVRSIFIVLAGLLLITPVAASLAPTDSAPPADEQDAWSLSEAHLEARVANALALGDADTAERVAHQLELVRVLTGADLSATTASRDFVQQLSTLRGTHLGVETHGAGLDTTEQFLSTVTGQGGQSSIPNDELATARELLSLQASLAATTHPSLTPTLETQRAHLDQATELFEAIQPSNAGTDNAFAHSIQLAQAATKAQADKLGIELPVLELDSSHVLPSQAILTLIDQHGTPITPEVREQAARLDDLPEPLRAALTGVIDAYTAYDAAATNIYGHGAGPSASQNNPASSLAGDNQAERAPSTSVKDTAVGAAAPHGQQTIPNAQASNIPPGPRAPTQPQHATQAPNVPSALEGADPGATTHKPTSEQEVITAPGSHPTPSTLGELLAARNHLLDATVDLRQALNDLGPSMPASSHDVIDMPPDLRIDFSNTDREYNTNYTLVIDVGGSDTYLNNAGGNVFGDCQTYNDAAALIDLHNPLNGPEMDLFSARSNNQKWLGHACGKNGGGDNGTGLLINEGGNDIYGDKEADTGIVTGFDRGVNGGANNTGLGLLVDTGGADWYEASKRGVNGGGHSQGNGSLIDTGGNDDYHARARGANGGGHLHGNGTLIDTDGNDAYLAANNWGTNGGGSNSGRGLLIDTDGTDTYDANDFGTNGGGSWYGHGTLIDTKGDDDYTAESHGVNGGAENGGTGLLIDTLGNDDYEGLEEGVNGGASGIGAGTLVDLNGQDTYTATAKGVNGGAYRATSNGLLADLDLIPGTSTSGDTFTALGGQGANGGANGPNRAILVDTGQESTFNAGSDGTNGGATGTGTGLLVTGGPITVTAGDRGTNGGGYENGRGAIITLNAATTPTTYTAGSEGTNGGGHTGGHGFILDASIDPLAGDTTYQAGSHGTNGGATGTASTGALIDLGSGEDTTTAGDDGTNGGATDNGAGFLYNDNGEDTYTAGDDGTNGGATTGGVGVFIDQEEDDFFTAGVNGVNGGAVDATGLFIDGGGIDEFDEGDDDFDCKEPGNCNVIPKGNTGARIAL